MTDGGLIHPLVGKKTSLSPFLGQFLAVVVYLQSAVNSLPPENRVNCPLDPAI
jgi:hypothetical protein